MTASLARDAVRVAPLTALSERPARSDPRSRRNGSKGAEWLRNGLSLT